MTTTTSRHTSTHTDTYVGDGPDESEPDEARSRAADPSTPGGAPPDAEWPHVESDTASFPQSQPVPIPVLAPYLGLVAAVLCTLGGGWLLLAPYALDVRHGAKHLPRAALVDLETGAAIIAVAVAAAVLFSVNLVLRLRADRGPVLAVEPEPEAPAVAAPGQTYEPAPTPATVPSARSKEADPGGALRELLTPLVAALAADLRSHDQDRAREPEQERQPGDAYLNQRKGP